MPSLACHSSSNYPSSSFSFSTGPSLTLRGMHPAIKLDLVSLKPAKSLGSCVTLDKLLCLVESPSDLNESVVPTCGAAERLVGNSMGGT